MYLKMYNKNSQGGGHSPSHGVKVNSVDEPLMLENLFY